MMFLARSLAATTAKALRAWIEFAISTLNSTSFPRCSSAVCGQPMTT